MRIEIVEVEYPDEQASIAEELTPGETTPDDLLQKCSGLERSPSILDELQTELELQGYAGSTRVPKLVFLALYTRYLEKPVSLVIKGPSSSGKSYGLKAGMNFVPEDAYEVFHGMSEKALVYANLDLKHRYLVIQEAAGMNKEVGRAFLRQLMSEGKIRYATVQSTENGLESKELDHLEGPVGVMMTTTANALHHEDESRMLSIQMDDPPERTRAILMAQAGAVDKNNYQPAYESWHALHRLIGTGRLEVEVPYAADLAKELPISHPRVQRDFPMLLSLIKAHALMHQFSRERNQRGAVIATVEDYGAVHSLVADAMAEGLEAAVAEHVAQVVKAVEDVVNEANIPGSQYLTGASTGAIADRLGKNRSSIIRAVWEAERLGYLVNKNPGQGKTAELVLGDVQLPDAKVLPDPDRLRKE